MMWPFTTKQSATWPTRDQISYADQTSVRDAIAPSIFYLHSSMSDTRTQAPELSSQHPDTHAARTRTGTGTGTHEAMHLE